MQYPISDIHIKQIEVGAQLYDVSAIHFLYSVSGLTLDIAQDWKNYIDSQVAEAAKVQIILPPNNILPTASAETLGKIYLIAMDTAEAGSYVEWVTVESTSQDGDEITYNYTWEKIGTTSVDLDEYATKADVNAAFDSVHTTSPSSSLTSVGGASAVSVIAAGSQNPTGIATEVLQDIVTSKSSSIDVTGLAFSGTAVTVPDSTYNFAGHDSVLPKGSITGEATIGGHTHIIQQTMRTVYSTVTNGASVEVVTGITTTSTNVATSVTKSTTSALFNLSVTSNGVLHFNTTPVITSAGVNTSAAVNSVGGIYSSTVSISSLMQAYSGAFGSVDVLSNTFRAEPLIIGVVSPGKSYFVNRSLTSISTNSNSSGSSTISHLFRNTTM